MPEGHEGWDAYAPFYDWENAQTLGRRDVPFWRRLALSANGRVLELGSGTGRVSRPLSAAGVDLVGIDRSAAMLSRAVARGARLKQATQNARLKPSRHGTQRVRLKPSRDGGFSGSYVRGDIRHLPFADRSFAMVIAPYGVVQSLTRERDLVAALTASARVLERGGTFGVDLVPDVPRWREYDNRVQFRGNMGRRHLTLVESVRQDRRRHLTTFSQTYIERIGRERTTHSFDLTFRTLSVPQTAARLERAGFVVEHVLGDYRGRPWDTRADVWIILAKKR